MQLRASLRSTNLFQSLSEAQLDSLSARGRRLKLARGQTLFREGDKATGLFVVLSGKVKVSKSSRRGREQILLLLGPGETVGEAAMFAGDTYPANSEALEATEVFSLPRGAFLEVIRAEPEVAMRLFGALSARMRSFASLIEYLSLREVSERLAAHLLRLDVQAGLDGLIELELTKTQLAATFGTVPETLSRAFRQLSEIGAIDTSKRRVRIKDRGVLERVAQGR
jgi:CRP/FNR family transcriptional regulator, dissimilatory nitrate respiration regulator